MELLVDFNMEEEDGRIPARISATQVHAVAQGDKVRAFDGEGTECWAVIDEVDSTRHYVMLTPIPGTAKDPASSDEPATSRLFIA